MGYREVYEQSLTDPDGFWAEAAQAIDWIERPTTVLDDSAAPMYRWFTGGVLNTCHNALDRHVDGGQGRPARARLRQPGHRHGPHVHLSRTP